MNENFRFFFKQLTQKLWFRPLIYCLLSIAAALVAHFADMVFLDSVAPEIKKSSLVELLSTMSNSMLVIAIFAVGSMLSAYAAGSATATPRSFKLIVADDVSQSALSVFIGSFIFSIVSSIALKNGYYGDVGTFTLFLVTLAVFVLVILTFLRWVDRISKLGRLGHTIQNVEEATAKGFRERKEGPTLGGIPLIIRNNKGMPIFSQEIGYVQHINMSRLQDLAEDNGINVVVNSLPGTFMSPEKPLAYLIGADPQNLDDQKEITNKAFIIGTNRSYVNDPRFGLIALSEIASRALSPAVNDPGTAIAIIGTYVRLFSLWLTTENTNPAHKVIYDRVEVPNISLADFFQDAFRPIARDGAGNIEVMFRLQKALKSIAHVGSPEAKELAIAYSLQAYRRSEIEMSYKEDLKILKTECLFISDTNDGGS